MQRPKLKAHFRPEPMEPDHVVLLEEHSHEILMGRAFVHLIPLLDGRRSVDDIVTLLDGTVSAAELYFAAFQAEKEGYLVDAESEPDAPPAEAAFWHARGIGVKEVQERLRAQSVSVRAFGAADAGPLLRALSVAGVRVVAGGGDLTVAVTDDYLQSGLEEVNRESLEAGRPWLLLKPVGLRFWLGPFLVPGKTGCFTCLAQRLGQGRQMEAYLLGKTGRKSPFPTSAAELPCSVEMAVELATTEIVKWLVTGASEKLEGQVLTVDSASLTSETHRLVKRPQCPDCGSGPACAGDIGPRPVRLAPSLKRFQEDGGHRSLLPEETLARFGHHVSPVTGAITSLRSRSEEPGLTYSFVAVHRFPMFRDRLSTLQANMRGRSGGKGMGETQARASALAEALERYSGVWCGDGEIAIQATARELGDKAVSLERCLGFSERQKANRAAWNRALTEPHHVVPAPLPEDLRISWTPLWSLSREEERYLPTAYCYFGHPDMEHMFCLSDTNGCAAGNTLEEAICQGLLELIERDGVAIWWYNRLRRPAVDVESFDLPYFEQLRTFYRDRRRDITVLDLTNDLGVPIMAAVSARLEGPTQDVLLGFGAHLDPRIALLRALTELNQSYPFVAESDAEGNTQYTTDNAEMIRWFETATRAAEPYVTPDPAKGKTPLSAFQSRSHPDTAADVRFLVSRLNEAALETLVLDQTRADIGMPVCRVVVPGLCHFWRRLGHERLRGAPVRAGWLRDPVSEEDMNPWSIFF